MELQQLRYFAAVARLGNFTRAAEACHVSQPTLSKLIAKLELELGQSLFHRGGRIATLTDAGRAFQERTEHALRLLDEARESVRTAGKKMRFTVSAIPTVAPYLLPAALTRFVAAHPSARVEVKEYTTEESLKQLTEGHLDAAVLALPVRDEHLSTKTLFTEELFLALPAAHRLADSSKIRLKDLADESFVILHEAHCLSGQAAAFCARHALGPLVTAQLHQLGTVLELVRLGHGVSFVPEMATRHEKRTDVVFRSIAGEKPTRTLAIAWSQLRFRSPLFNDFVKCLEPV